MSRRPFIQYVVIWLLIVIFALIVVFPLSFIGLMSFATLLSLVLFVVQIPEPLASVLLGGALTLGVSGVGWNVGVWQQKTILKENHIIVPWWPAYSCLLLISIWIVCYWWASKHLAFGL
jgi:hypothetical protein